MADLAHDHRIASGGLSAWFVVTVVQLSDAYVLPLLAPRCTNEPSVSRLCVLPIYRCIFVISVLKPELDFEERIADDCIS